MASSSLATATRRTRKKSQKGILSDGIIEGGDVGNGGNGGDVAGGNDGGGKGVGTIVGHFGVVGIGGGKFGGGGGCIGCRGDDGVTGDVGGAGGGSGNGEIGLLLGGHDGQILVGKSVVFGSMFPSPPPPLPPPPLPNGIIPFPSPPVVVVIFGKSGSMTDVIFGRRESGIVSFDMSTPMCADGHTRKNLNIFPKTQKLLVIFPLSVY